ncbi:MAG: VWA domain-containing protein [Rhodospirillaceae bacterium]|nr:VWA domain-containing protein [Rhodospirillaceae bacterium]
MSDFSALPVNIMHFARVLRRAGLPIGPGKLIDGLNAINYVDVTQREDMYWALHAVFVDRHAQSELFRLAFERFFQASVEPDVGLSLLDNVADAAPPPAKPVPRRLSDAFADAAPRGHAEPAEDADPSADGVASWSAAERLRQQDFETMSAAEWSDARALITTLRLPIPETPTRRFAPAHAGPRVDMRATLRGMVRAGGAWTLVRKRRRLRHPPIVALCDISGSMAAYSRILLHFLHAITNDRDRVHVFLFGTRLSNITREIAHRDPDVALARVGRSVQDWGGGTRIGQALAEFNRRWSRRVLGQGAVVLLISDGLDRDGGDGLAKEMALLHRSCRRLIWLNPLLRYAAFEPKSLGIKAMLPHVDDFRPVHNLDSLADLVAALSDHHADRPALRAA